MLIQKQFDDLFPCAGEHLPYQKAERKIRKTVTDPTIQEQMLFLLEKSSRSDHLGIALEKTMIRYGVEKKDVKKRLGCFDEIGVNPITFKKDSKIKRFPSFLEIPF